MSVFGDYKAEDVNIVKEANDIFVSIDMSTINIEHLAKQLDSAELSLLMPYLDCINVLAFRCIKFIKEIKEV